MNQWRRDWTCLVEDYQATHEADLDTRMRNNQAADATWAEIQVRRLGRATYTTDLRQL